LVFCFFGRFRTLDYWFLGCLDYWFFGFSFGLL